MIKHHDQKQRGAQRGFCLFTYPNHKPSPNEARAGTDKDHRATLFTGLLSYLPPKKGQTH